MAPGDWWAHHTDGSVSASCRGVAWSSFSTLEQVGSARLHVSNEPLRQVKIWTGREFLDLFPPDMEEPRRAFAYRWTVMPVYELFDITHPEDMQVTFRHMYTGFGCLNDDGKHGILLKVSYDAQVSLERFSLVEPFPF